MKYAPILLMLTLSLVAGCVQDQPLKEIVIPGHNVVYLFTYDVRESIKVASDNEKAIRSLFTESSSMNIIYEGSSSRDNAYFIVALTNIGNKLRPYLENTGRSLDFNYYYYIGDYWYNSTDEIIGKPNLTTPTLVLKGPETGATETSVKLSEQTPLGVNALNNTIVLQGTSYRNLTLAADKLSLIILDVTQEQVEQKK
ncbi:MAG: hypothetical protein HY513_01455 [Candidatus Aenigmarchaeota archaeon]|nr:hypothetical protein [Candidatus Aenigmarchaeota archaeon]